MGNILYKSVKFVTRYLQLDYQDIKTHTCDECDYAFSATSSSILCFKVKLLLRCCSESVAGSKGLQVPGRSLGGIGGHVVVPDTNETSPSRSSRHGATEKEDWIVFIGCNCIQVLAVKSLWLWLQNLSIDFFYRLHPTCFIGTDKKENEKTIHTLKCEFHFRDPELEIIESVTLN